MRAIPTPLTRYILGKAAASLARKFEKSPRLIKAKAPPDEMLARLLAGREALCGASYSFKVRAAPDPMFGVVNDLGVGRE